MAIIPAGRHDKKTGSKRMKEFGYKKVEIWFDAKEADAVIAAAAKDGCKLATWCRLAAVQRAKQELPTLTRKEKNES